MVDSNEVPDKNSGLAPSESSGYYQSAFVNAAIASAVVSPDGYWLEVNRALCSLLGYSEAELRSTTFQALTHPDDLEKDLTLLASTVRGERHGYEIEKRYVHKDGTTLWGHLLVAAVRDDGQLEHFVSQIHNITAQKQVEANLKEQTAFRDDLITLVEASLSRYLDADFYQYLLDTAVRVLPGAQSGSLLLKDESGRFQYAAAVGYDLPLLKTTFLLEHELFLESEDAGPHLIYSFDNSSLPEERLAPIIKAGPSEAMKVALAIPVYLDDNPLAYIYLDNREDAQAFSSTTLQMAKLFGQQVAAVWQRLRLETELTRQQRRLEHQALHDPLTSLPNRTLLHDRLAQALAQVKRNGHRLGIVFIDLDDFKSVNDTYGHKVGDLYLQGVGQRLLDSVRTSDTVARFGGDEFVLLLTNVKAKTDAVIVVERILTNFEAPLTVDKFSLKVGLSLGIALYPEHAATANDLLNHADEALYKAKAAGKQGYALYRPLES